MKVDIYESAEMIYLAENKEEGVSFKEIKALQYFGLTFNFEPETDVEILQTEILRCIWFYIAMYRMKTHVKKFEQMCVDEILYQLPFTICFLCKFQKNCVKNKLCIHITMFVLTKSFIFF